jgi:hypothetical protein
MTSKTTRAAGPAGGPTPTHMSTWTRETDAFGAFVAACSCGWTGRHDHPPDEHGRTTAEDEWELHHAQPLLAAAVQTGVRERADNLREEVAELADHRPPAPAPSPTGWPGGPSTSCA